jgi:formylglycine-generating enzyme required for sulfatase activity
MRSLALPVSLQCFVALTLSLAFSCPAQAFTYDLVTVGNAGNAADTTGYGAVAYDYQIGKYEVTIGQYAAFLNAVANANDDYGLYDSQLGTRLTISGISKSDIGGVATYTPLAPQGDNPYGQSADRRPISYATWFTAARFANWMANGQPMGPPSASTTEDGAYALYGRTTGTAPGRNVVNPNTGAAPTYWIPTENEWYKSAYYSPDLNGGAGGYHLYATQSDSGPGNRIGSSGNQANGYIFVGNQQYLYSTRTSPIGLVSSNFNQNYLTDVGAFAGSQSFYGTFDQNGNVWEWNDLDGQASTLKGFRGGNWDYDSAPMRSTARYQTFARGEDFWSSNGQYMGFRLAATVAVPEPTAGLTFAGLSLIGWLAARRTRLL